MSASWANTVADHSVIINPVASVITHDSPFADAPPSVTVCEEATEMLVIKIHAQNSSPREMAHTETFAIAATKILQVYNQTMHQSIPFMPKGMLGIVSLRGRTFPVLCLSFILGLGAATPDANTSLLLAEMEQHNLLGFTVQNLAGRVKLERDFIKSAKGVDPVSHYFVTGLCNLPNNEVAKILNLDALARQFFSAAKTKANRSILATETSGLVSRPCGN